MADTDTAVVSDPKGDPSVTDDTYTPIAPSTPVLNPSETPVDRPPPFSIDNPPFQAPAPGIPDYLQPASQGTFDDAAQKAAGFQQGKIKADAAINSQLDQRYKSIREEQERNLKAEGYLASQISKPWDAKAETEAHTTPPMEKFGNAAMIFAGIASAFSKTPAISALNAGAAVLNAINANDAEGYKRAYTAWKDNTDLAIKRFNMQRDIYADTNQLFDKDINMWKIKMTENATRFGDQQALNLLQHNQYPQFFEAEKIRADAMEKAIEGADHMKAVELRRQMQETSFGLIDQEIPMRKLGPGEKPTREDMKTQQLNIAAKQAQQEVIVSPSGSLPALVAQMKLDMIKEKHRIPTAEEIAKFKVEAEQKLYSGSRSVTGGTAAQNATDSKAAIASYEEATGEAAPPEVAGIIRKVYDAKGVNVGARQGQIGRAIENIRANNLTGPEAVEAIRQAASPEPKTSVVDERTKRLISSTTSDIDRALELLEANPSIGTKIGQLSTQWFNTAKYWAGQEYDSSAEEFGRKISAIHAQLPTILSTSKQAKTGYQDIANSVGALQTASTPQGVRDALMDFRQKLSTMEGQLGGSPKGGGTTPGKTPENAIAWPGKDKAKIGVWYLDPKGSPLYYNKDGKLYTPEEMR